MTTKKPTSLELVELTTFPERLKYARTRAKLTKAALAKRAGMDPSRMTRLESGERVQGIEAATVIRLARELGTSVGWLAADEGEVGPVPTFQEGHDRRHKPNRSQRTK